MQSASVNTQHPGRRAPRRSPKSREDCLPQLPAPALPPAAGQVTAGHSLEAVDGIFLYRSYEFVEPALFMPCPCRALAPVWPSGHPQSSWLLAKLGSASQSWEPWRKLPVRHLVPESCDCVSVLHSGVLGQLWGLTQLPFCHPWQVLQTN